MKSTLSLFISICLLTPVCLYAQPRYSVVISEIMADPSPQVGLPNAEWIELTNVSAIPVSLQQMRIADATGQSGPLPVYILQPGSRLIICSSSSLSALSAFGPAVAVTSFPSLDNDGEIIQLKAADGRVIHAVAYESSWYNNALKKEGGWSLEMTDTGQPCAGRENWTASGAATGGTPGQQNASAAAVNVNSRPELLHSFCPDSTHILLYFTKPVDSAAAESISRYTISNSIRILRAVTIPPLYTNVLLQTETILDTQTVYQVTVQGMPDCKGQYGADAVISAGMSKKAGAGDLVINEILFNPVTNGYDYVEFYNKSRKVLDVAGLFIAGMNSSGAISGINQLSSYSFSLFPGEYLVATADPAGLRGHFMVKFPDRIQVISSMPSLPDDEGAALLLDNQGSILDEIHYKDDWHFALIRDPEGVSLERLDPSGSSQDAGNWHSAASTAGYGTPGYRNSQYISASQTNGTVEISPAVFSPDNDGRDDICTIRYRLSAPGSMGTVQVFNTAGTLVKVIANNVLLGISGEWYWDGLDQNGRRLPIGNYIVLFSWFDLTGHKKQEKQVVILARSLN